MTSPWVVRSEPGVVFAGSMVPLPFEPRGEMRQFRDELRKALRQQHVRGVVRVETTFSSQALRQPDLENVLLYNVSLADSVPRSAKAVTIERAPFVAMPVPDAFPNRHSYKFLFEDGGDAPQHWQIAGLPFHIATSLPSTDRHFVWWALRGTREVDSLAEGNSPLGLWLTFGCPYTAPAAHMKSIIDGVVAALHLHDGRDSDEISNRLARHLGEDPAVVSSYLGAATTDHSVGRQRRLFGLRSDGVQIYPADDRLQFISFRTEKSPALHLSARIQALEPNPTGA